jgi:hypothetical protein
VSFRNVLFVGKLLFSPRELYQVRDKWQKHTRYYWENMRASGKWIPVAVLSKAWVCDRLIAGNVGWNPDDGMDIRLCVCCVLCR